MSASDVHRQPPGSLVDPPILTCSQIVKRDGRSAPPDRSRISHAIEMAYRAELGVPFPDPLRLSVTQTVEGITDRVIVALNRTTGSTGILHVEEIQDEVERQLMASGAYAVARRFIVYREARARLRDEQSLRIVDVDGQELSLSRSLVRSWIEERCDGLTPSVSPEAIAADVLQGIHRGATVADIDRLIVFAARTRIEREPAYSFVAARSLLKTLAREVAGRPVDLRELADVYPAAFASYIAHAVATDRLDPALTAFDLDRLGRALVSDRDFTFQYLGLQTLYDRYLIHESGRRMELPQMFWMRVAMGLALNEPDQDARAIEFYELLSTYRFCSSTPTLFNAGTLHPQLSSCYLTTIPDDLDQIFKGIRDNALLSKWSGGLGNDWTPVRALGSHIKGTNGVSQGVVPFLKVANDAAVAVNQGGKRKGAVCAYLETWHLDIEEFLELRKNTGDDRRRTHDMNTANWIPDLFMQRVAADSHWTLFSPDDVPDLHDLYGTAFAERYQHYESLADAGEIPLARTVRALDLWRKMLTALFETGHPWITFKDPSNIRSSQQHAGVVHNSNLCTEILLNTSQEEIAVCNLGSVNLVTHIRDGQIDSELLGETVRTAMRMLDNVIDLNFYPVPEARTANLKHRPVGLGVMGFQDALYALGISYGSEDAVTFADRSQELVAWHAILASANLASERGAYASFPGSTWDRGLLPLDTLTALDDARSEPVPVDRSAALDWQPVRDAIKTHGMRNSNTMAIAPTATIANIVGVSQSIEPTYANLFVKSNLSGDFTVVNEHLIRDLGAIDLWDDEMLSDLKYHDGSVQEIDRIPDEIKARYLTAFEVDPSWLVESAARRQKWIDMGQSLNLYVNQPSGRVLSDLYQLAWRKGLKTTYYLRGRSATQAEKSTLDVNRHGVQPRWMKARSASADIQIDRTLPDAAACSLDGDCEACQ